MDDDEDSGWTGVRLRVVPAAATGSRLVKVGPRPLVDRVQAAAEGAVDAFYQLRAALSTLMDSLPESSGLVRTPLGIVCAPDDPRCVAITTRRARCANPVFDTSPWSGGVLAVLHDDAHGFPNQLCRLHRRRPPNSTVPLEWFIVGDASSWSELQFI